MLRWRELHPYNAVHVVRVDAPLDARASRATSTRCSRRAGSPASRSTPRDGATNTRAAPRTVPLEVLAGRRRPARGACARRSSAASTRAFAPTGTTDPFRFFAVDAGASFHVGVAYDHVVAGGDSIVELLAEHRRCATRDASAAHPPPDALSADVRAAVRAPCRLRARGDWRRSPRRLRALRRSLRPRYPLRRRSAQRLRARADRNARRGRAGIAPRGAWGVTRGDLMLALLMQRGRAVAASARDAATAARDRRRGRSSTSAATSGRPSTNRSASS